jgi:hypothetical protein
LAEFVDSVAQIGPELSGKRLELLGEVVPKLRNTVLSNRGNTAVVISLQRTRTAAKILDLSAESSDVREPRELGRAFSIIVEKLRDGLVLLLHRSPGDCQDTDARPWRALTLIRKLNE